MVVCNAFKAYMQGVLLSIKTYKNKKHKMIHSELISQFKISEEDHKRHLFQISSQVQAKNELKMTDAHLLARDRMYTKQWVFEFRDKPG